MRLDSSQPPRCDDDEDAPKDDAELRSGDTEALAVAVAAEDATLVAPPPVVILHEALRAVPPPNPPPRSIEDDVGGRSVAGSARTMCCAPKGKKHGGWGAQTVVSLVYVRFVCVCVCVRAACVPGARVCQRK